LPNDIQKVYLRLANYRYLNDQAEKYYKLSKDQNNQDIYVSMFSNDNSINDKHRSWSSIINENPESLNFWFDFIEANNSELGKYAISSIGDRPKVVNDNNIKALIYREIPDVLFMD